MYTQSASDGTSHLFCHNIHMFILISCQVKESKAIFHLLIIPYKQKCDKITFCVTDWFDQSGYFKTY